MPTDPHALIRARFRIKPHDSLPFTGWAEVTRVDLIRIFNELGYKAGAEIGVAQATFSQALLRAIPGLRLICVDPWQAYERTSQRICDERYARAVKRLTPYGAEIKRMTSLEAAREVADGSLDFVYIDGAHDFDHVMLDLILWTPKVRPGGIVAGHDYYEFYQAGVTTAVRAYTQAHNITQWYVTKEKDCSWLWVR
jgi:predicted O-methyltransferase YrrM